MSNYDNQSKNNTPRIYIRSQRRWQKPPKEIHQEYTLFHNPDCHLILDRGLCCCPPIDGGAVMPTVSFWINCSSASPI